MTYVQKGLNCISNTALASPKTNYTSTMRPDCVVFERFFYSSTLYMAVSFCRCKFRAALSDAVLNSTTGLCFRVFVWMKLGGYVYRILRLLPYCRRLEPFRMFVHSIAVEKLPGRSHIRAIEMLDSTLR